MDRLFCFVYVPLSIVGRFPGTDLCMGFWDALKLGGFSPVIALVEYCRVDSPFFFLCHLLVE